MTPHDSRSLSPKSALQDPSDAPSTTSITEEPVTAPSRADQLEYMADMLLELNEIAERLGCPTLAAILSVAHREALVQSRSTGGRLSSV